VESTTYLGFLQRVETTPTVFVYGWCADFPDPQNWLTTYWRSTTSYAQRIGYKNAALDKLLDEADAEADPAKRIALYKQAEKMVLDDVAASPIYVTELAFLVKPYVTIGKTTSFDAMFPGFFEPLKLAFKR
jgi:oligopeptide transport system substrate-binding protein